MSVNAYSQAQPIGQTQFINTYSPIPFQEMMAVAEQYRQGYDQALDRQDKFNEFLITAGQQVIPGSKDQATYKDIMGKIEGGVDSLANQDLRDLSVQSRARSLIRSTMQNPFWGNASTNFKLYLNSEETRQRLIQEGKWSPLFEERYQEDVANFSSDSGKPFSPRIRAYDDDISKLVAANYVGWNQNLTTRERGYWLDNETDSNWHNRQFNTTVDELMNTQQGVDIIQNYQKNHPNTSLSERQIIEQHVRPHAEAFRLKNSTYNSAKYSADARYNAAIAKLGDLNSSQPTFNAGNTGAENEDHVTPSMDQKYKKAETAEDVKGVTQEMKARMANQGAEVQTADGGLVNENRAIAQALYDAGIQSITSNPDYVKKYIGTGDRFTIQYRARTSDERREIDAMNEAKGVKHAGGNAFGVDALKMYGVDNAESFMFNFVEKFVDNRSYGFDVEKATSAALSELGYNGVMNKDDFNRENNFAKAMLPVATKIDKDMRKNESWARGGMATIQQKEFERVSSQEGVANMMNIAIDPMHFANIKHGAATVKALNEFPLQAASVAQADGNWVFRTKNSNDWKNIKEGDGDYNEDFLKDKDGKANFTKFKNFIVRVPAQGDKINKSWFIATDDNGNEMKIAWSSLSDRHKEYLKNYIGTTAATRQDRESLQAYNNLILAEMYDQKSLNDIVSNIGKSFGVKVSAKTDIKTNDGQHEYKVNIAGSSETLYALSPYDAIVKLIDSLEKAYGKKYPPEQNPAYVSLSGIQKYRQIALAQAQQEVNSEWSNEEE